MPDTRSPDDLETDQSISVAASYAQEAADEAADMSDPIALQWDRDFKAVTAWMGDA